MAIDTTVNRTTPADTAAPATRMTARHWVQLCKLRIGTLIALTAVMGYMALEDDLSIVAMIALAAAMMLGSAASSVFNHFYDRDIDRMMTRTAKRPLAVGLTSNAGALWFAALLLVAGLSLAATAFNWVVALHLFLGAFVYGIVYTVWLKRRHWLNIVIGGAAGSFAVLAGAAAVDPSAWLLPWIMALILFLWTPSHFWALAIMLKDDYARAGVPMLPVVKGETSTARAIMVNSLLLFAATLAPTLVGELGWLYLVGAVAFGGHFLWLNLQLLKTPGERPAARRVFLGSMQYLVGLFLATVLDKHLPAAAHAMGLF